MQKVTLTGHIGRDASVQTNQKTGSQFVSFSVAVTQRARVDRETGEEKSKETTRWWNVSTQQITLAPYLKKGTMVLVMGDFDFSIYKDKEGKGRPDFKCYAREIELLSSKKEVEQESKEEIPLEAEA